MDRLALSRQVVATWETMGGPTESEGNLRMIGNEVEILRAFGREHPDRSAEADQLVSRYTALADKISARLHIEAHPAATPYRAPDQS
ncbi:hypothetical protein GCM10007989_14030 [Devosia pacifica]|uniref:Uncharacterized protein n=1 Tax=Devosia pacifica TaxID=1335967 RepID=A0A918S1M6_9HYPH|nr:hypothetical protein [Devosia pacifica]GHA19627.1 hypothetical protein GCM10007989_14030 [Devosia pacifica]